MDFCRYVNVFQGCGEIDLPKPEGIAARWFFIKAGCGNTTPGASLPFSKITAAPFSGGYPTGYGDHYPNSHSRPVHFSEGKKLRGFAHLQQSGTGAIGYYYNYAVVTPRFAESPERMMPAEEFAEPGYYRTVLDGIVCELTVTERLALHRYTFPKEGGEVVIDFTNNGLHIPLREKKKVQGLTVSVNGGIAEAKAVIEGVTLFFAVRTNVGTFTADGEKAAIKLPAGQTCAELAVAISAKDELSARNDVSSRPDFDMARKNAYARWNETLSRIAIETDSDEIREIFYSNLYHSLIKPSDWSGESFLYGDGAFMIDLATLWDMYKTALPLIFLSYKEPGEKIAETLLRTGETLGWLPNSLGLNAECEKISSQARMLGDYTLMTAYRFGLDIDPKRMLNVIKNDVFADNKKDFTEKGKCKSHTFLLDMADGCAYAAAIAQELGDEETAAQLLPHADKWRNAYSKKTGLLRKNSEYYEGTLYNYSFRQTAAMDERIALAKGNERFVRLLDSFFGYGQPETVQPTDPHDYAPVAEGMMLGRFEGYNNESDMEAPFSYVYAGRHDRMCEVVRGGMRYMFTTGRGGIPGNNDTGALSSYYVWCALGLFPVAGSDTVLLASPFLKSAKIKLSSGGELNIRTDFADNEHIYVKKALFNGREIKDFHLKIKELMRGGTLEFFMSDTP